MKHATKSSTKTKDTAKQNVTKVNLATAAKKTQDKIQIERETKYIYPESAKTPKQRKDFRRTARASKSRFEKILKKLQKSNDAADQREYKKQEHEFAAWRKETYSK